MSSFIHELTIYLCLLLGNNAKYLNTHKERQRETLNQPGQEGEGSGKGQGGRVREVCTLKLTRSDV